MSIRIQINVRLVMGIYNVLWLNMGVAMVCTMCTQSC